MISILRPRILASWRAFLDGCTFLGMSATLNRGLDGENYFSFVSFLRFKKT